MTDITDIKKRYTFTHDPYNVLLQDIDIWDANEVRKNHNVLIQDGLVKEITPRPIASEMPIFDGSSTG